MTVSRAINDEVTRRHRIVVELRIESTRIHEEALLHAHDFGVLIHHVCEGFFATRNMLGDRDAGVIARLNNNSAQEVLGAHHRIDPNEGLGALHTPSLLADMHGRVERETTTDDLFDRDIRRHDFSQACGREAPRRRSLESIPGRSLASIKI